MNSQSHLRRLFKHFSHFFGGNLLVVLFGLITFPLLTRILTQEQYGVLTLVNATAALTVALAKGGLSDSIIRYYHEHSGNPESLKIFTSTVLTRSAVFSAFFSALYMLAVPFLVPLLGIRAQFMPCFMVMTIYLFARPLDIVGMNYLRALGKTVFFNGVSLTTKFVSVAGSILLLLLFSRNLTAFFVGPGISEIVAVAILFRWLLSSHSYSLSAVSGPLAWKLINFGAPLLLTEMGYLLLMSADRYFISAMRGQAELSVYAVGYNLPTYLNDLVMFSISYAIVPIYTDLYAKQGLEPTRDFLNKAMHYYAVGVIPMCFGYAAVAQDAIVVFASEKYRSAAAFSPIILCGLVLLGMNYILYAGLYIGKRTRQITGAMLAALAVNLSFDFLLIPKYGAMGAAYATLLACVTSAILTAAMSFRLIAVRIPVGTIVFYVAVSFAMYRLLRFIESGNAGRDLVAKLLVGSVFVATVVLLRERTVREQLLRLMGRMPDAGPT